jgi:valyl-tRNA synthetase
MRFRHRATRHDAVVHQVAEKPKNGKLSLRDLAVKAVRSKKIKIIPYRYEKVLMHWLSNLRDWNISRQIVWASGFPFGTANAEKLS